MYDLNKEKQEAINAGRKAMRSLEQAEEYLQSAKSWGLWDMFSDGFMTTWVKRSKMNKAKQCMDQAKYDLQVFQRELRDVSSSYNLGFETGGFLEFADWFFDNFFVDWMVQDQIKQALNNVQTAKRRIKDIIRQLER